MKYHTPLDLKDWHKLRDQLIDFRNTRGNTEVLWWCHFEDEVKEHLPDLYAAFKELGLSLRQLIFFVNLPNDIDISDPTDSKAIFIHTDSEDSEDQIGDGQPLDQMFATKFQTTAAINIPLENCEGTITLWYEKKDNITEVLYPHYGCGGWHKDDVVEVCRYELATPTVIRINVPHGVYNPGTKPRLVATMRFYEDTTDLLKML